MNDRTPAARAYSAAAPAPTSAASGTLSTDPASRSPAGGSTNAATSAPTSTSCRPHPSDGSTRPSSHTASVISAGGTSV